MARDRQTPEELAARMRSARAYRKLDQIPVAKKLGVNASTLGTYETGAIPASKVSGLIDRSIEVFGLPEEFFVLDFSELPQMSDAWDQVKRLRRPLADLERLVEKDLDEDSRS